MDESRTYYSREAEMRAAREKAALTFVFLLLGLGIGTALALLFAPRSGSEIRDELSHATEGALNQGRDAVNPALKRLEKEFADLRKRVDDRISDMR
jgi:gas vesicle protein